MLSRPIRSQIYLPVLRFGITDEDWGIVLLASVLGYAVPFFLNLRVYHLPLELLGWLICMGFSILILNLIRRKQRPSWLLHIFQWYARKRIQRRWWPHEFQPDWLRSQSQETTFRRKENHGAHREHGEKRRS
ncbi:MAG: hypothetical protein JST84_11345 [Acidobacteria bacterium]|nr:hypothetical protein [Acidobacteriota bacterium]